VKVKQHELSHPNEMHEDGRVISTGPWSARAMLGLIAFEGLVISAVSLVRSGATAIEASPLGLILLAIVPVGTALTIALLVRSCRDPVWAAGSSRRVFAVPRVVPYGYMVGVTLASVLVGTAIYFWPEWVDSNLKFASLEYLWPLGVWAVLIAVEGGVVWLLWRLPRRLIIPSWLADTIAISILLVLSLSARLPMTGYALPYQGVWDEVVTYPQAMRMLTSPGLEQTSQVPGYGNAAYGDLLVYVTAAGEVLGLLDGLRSQQIASVEAFVAPPRGVHSIYEAVHVSGIPLRYPRLLLAVLNSLAPVGIFLILRKYLRSDAWLGFGGAVIFALLSRDVIYYSSYILPDALATTLFVFLTLAAFEAMSVDEDRLLPWVACSALAGMIVSVAVRDFPALLVPPGAFILARNRARPYTKLATMALATFLGFVLTSPYALLGLPDYLAKITSFTWTQDFTLLHRIRNVIYYFRGAFASGFDSTYVDSTTDSVGLGGLAGLLALVGVAGGLVRYPRKTLLVLGYSAVQLYSVSSVVQKYTRHVLMLYPLVCIFAAVGLMLASDGVRRGLKRFRNGELGSRSRGSSALVLVAFLGLSAGQAFQVVRYVQRTSLFQPSQVRVAEYLEETMHPDDKAAILDQIPWVEADLVKRGISFERVDAHVHLATLASQGFTLVVGTDRIGGAYSNLNNDTWVDKYRAAGMKLAEFGHAPLQFQGFPDADLYLFVGRVPGTSP
jgi:hypothetical protein